MKKLLTLLLAFVLTATCFVGCKNPTTSSLNPDSSVDGGGESEDNPLDDLYEYGEAQEGVYTYQDSVSMLSSSWNRLTYQTTDQAYPLDFMSSGLYSFYFNEDFDGYEGLITIKYN